MSDKVVLINNSKLKQLIGSPLANSPSSAVGSIFKQAQQRLEDIAKAKGCGCNKAPKRNAVYVGVLHRLRNLDPAELEIIKQYLNVTILNLGKGYQV